MDGPGDGSRPNSIWTIEKVDSLKKFWADGLSASTIALELGGGAFTRNAVIGKVHRLGLGKDDAKRTVRPGSRARVGGRPKRVRLGGFRANPPVDGMPAELEQEPPPPSTEFLCTLDTLQSDSCRAPIGHPGDDGFRYCGVKQGTKLPGPYCPFHHRLYYQAGTANGDRRAIRMSDGEGERARVTVIEVAEHVCGVSLHMDAA